MDTLDQTMEMVLSGRADATLNAEVSVYDYLRAHPDANIKIVALTDDASEVAIPVRKGEDSASLLAAVNQAIDELRADGTLRALSETYFGSDVSGSAVEAEAPAADESAAAEAPSADEPAAEETAAADDPAAEEASAADEPAAEEAVAE